jgi:hypothetical protein
MATRDTYRLNDLFSWGTLSAPSSIYPATLEAPQQTTPGSNAQDLLGGLLPWGCEPQEQSPQDPA